MSALSRGLSRRHGTPGIFDYAPAIGAAIKIKVRTSWSDAL
jgi:hypothetical protein